MGSKFVPITRKVSLIIIISLAIGLGAVVFYFSSTLTTTIEDSTADNLEGQSRILYTAVENFMLPGQAPLAVQYFREMEVQNPLSSVGLFRADGRQAFTDNKTIHEVNENLGTDKFSPQERMDIEAERRDGQLFLQASTNPPSTSVFRRTGEDGEVYYRIYKPLINKPKCTSCHGSSHTIRGVIDIRNNITESVERRRQNLVISASVFLTAIIVLSIVLTRFMHGAILRPIKIVRDVCGAVTGGDFTRKVDFSKNDEIGELGKTVNTMVEGLHERYELSKYVSSSTLESLHSTRSGNEIELTLLFSDIRGFTSYSEKNEAEKVVIQLNGILNRQSEIIIENGGDIDKYVGDEIVALFTGEKGVEAACKSAMEIQKELEATKESFDGLSVGIGINYGKVILGMIGSQMRADYTVIGDNVNTASRLCSAAKAGEILISGSVHKRVARQFRFDGPYKARMKGKNRYVRVYKLI